jgi:hypothetical protein
MAEAEAEESEGSKGAQGSGASEGSEGFKVMDVEILHSLSGLMEIEMRKSYGEEDFMAYKGQSKGLLQKLLSKLESNFEYQQWQEGELRTLEEKGREREERERGEKGEVEQRLTASEEALVAQREENRQVCMYM